jgi:hypothetical protein
MSIKDLTDEDIKNFSEIELLDMDLSESVDKIFKTRSKFNTIGKHFLATLFLATLCSFIFSLGYYTPALFVPSLVLFFFLNRAGNNKKTALISFKMSILFYKDSGIIDESNEYLVKKYIEKIYS